MILIYTHKITNRFTYIFKVIFTDVLKTEVTFTSNIAEFKASTLPKINYSTSKIAYELFFESSSILFEKGIEKQTITVFEINENNCAFGIGKEAKLPFDPFAASFYLISRYEEYLPHTKDEHNRFMASESMAFQYGFLKTPVVNIWINQIAKSVEKKFKNFKFPEREFNYISTIDIDNAYAYKNKGALRITGGLVKALLTLNFTNLKERIRVLLNIINDPYDTYKYLSNIHQQYKIPSIYFFLLADYGTHDKNVSVDNKELQSLIKSISDNYEVGIHPSYASNKSETMLETEINRLKNITKKNILKSRQHYLKLTFPTSYQNLIKKGIEEDYTMGYAGESGFRASICNPYHFYDLTTETETELIIHPFTVMEATYQYYKKTSPEIALKEIIALVNKVKDVKGNFVSVWHNESLSNKGMWKGWTTIYEQMLAEFKK